MPLIKFEVPPELARTAIEHVSDLAHVRGLTVISTDGETDYRESEARCGCGRRLREERRGPAGTWVRYCPLHGDDGGAA
jgi:hypothetical protein